MTTESEQARLTRNVSELLQELRVAQAGVQLLFGFLLAVAFTGQFAGASDLQRAAHLVAVLFATAAVALLTAPAAWHRVLFRTGRRRTIIRVANRFAMAGLGCLAVAMTSTVLLLTDFLLGTWAAAVVTLTTAALFALAWFVLPLHARRSS